ncbi:MAG: hypothetical protein QOK48_2907 [Blastocatellia bacterium]|jgi:hypothetical protein|nr:hypothetical protein [Blastocatellia bacterium]
MNIGQLIERKAIKTIAGLFFLTLLLGAHEARAQCDGTRQLRFAPGLNMAQVRGAIPPNKAICYQLRARAGQRMIVSLTQRARSVLFTVIPEGYDVEPIAQNVASWDGVLDATGDYTISVHAPRAGQTFMLEVEVTSIMRANSSSRATVAPCGDFSGLYQTDYGPLRLTRTGDQVRGTYTTDSDKDSSISGTVRGNVLSGRWKEPSGKGTLRFTLASNGRSFKGSFAPDGESASGEWDGHCGDDGHK